MNDTVKICLNTKDAEDKTSEEAAAVTHESNQGVSEEIEQLQEKIDKKVENMPKEVGGRSKEKGLEPTRYGDWEVKGRCVDF